ncbi:MAG: oxygen-independent coproporphyrinogen III oxidase [Proteobacteria bacterium]|nr:oxygen-independent coproporphyrinogen III oxidase [Pseudomonadota bacterium]
MHMIQFDEGLIRRYDKAGPRYTSYPTAVQFTSHFENEDYKQQAATSNIGGGPLSLYFHLPFCNTVCFYCGCNKVVTKDRRRAAPYLECLHKEIALQSNLFDADRPVEQLHWGGGTPTFISHDEMRELMDVTGRFFNLLDDDSGEYSIEIDPREAHGDTVAILRSIGFNRMSLGVQDFEPQVQKAVNRIQSEEETGNVIDAARAEGFKSISIDLIYGLPFQSVASFDRTLEKVIGLSPDRLSVFNYAHMPDLFKPQRRINAADLPSPDEKLAILEHCIGRLTAAGYVYIGMDHFARPEDELAVAQTNGTLYRNFQGYSTHADCDLVAMGITSISKVGNCYAQNVKTLDDYTARIEAGELAVFRGVTLNADDILRRDVINQLICHFRLDISTIENRFDIKFRDYFQPELAALKAMTEDGLLTLSENIISVRPAGMLLIRNICMVFDAYLNASKEQRYSRVI